jgi:hypothetical protein
MQTCRGVLAALLLGGAVAQARDESPIPIEPDVRIQSLIDGIARASRRDLNYYEKVIALREAARARVGVPDGRRDVILQAAYYSAHGERPATPKPGQAEVDGEEFDAREALNQVTRELGIANSITIRTVLPYYLHGEDRRLREFIKGYVLRGESPTHELPENNELVFALSSYVGERKKDPPWGAVQLLYWKAPSAALMKMHGFYNTGDNEKHRALVWAEHRVRDVVWKKATGFIKPGERDDAVAELSKLSQYDEWWVKLYVAEMLRRHPFLRDPRILDRLRNDPNALVAKAADVPFHHGHPVEE